jgi:hypothetical protein
MSTNLSLPEPPFEGMLAEHLKDLGAEYRSAVKRAMSNVLSSKLALDTFAQIAYGNSLPNPDNDFLLHACWRHESQHAEPSREACNLVQELRANLAGLLGTESTDLVVCSLSISIPRP